MVESRDLQIQKTHYVWYWVDMLIFLTLNVIALWWLWPFHDALATATPLKLILAGLATYRLADIVSREVVTRPLREPFVVVREVNGSIIEESRYAGFKGAMGRLISCPSCVGVWAAAIFGYGYFILPNIFGALVVLFAISALERFFTIIILVLRRYAELLERKAS